MGLCPQENHDLQRDVSQILQTHCIPDPTHHQPPGASSARPVFMFMISAYGADLLELRRCPWSLPFAHPPPLLSPALSSTPGPSPSPPGSPVCSQSPRPLSVIGLAVLSPLQGDFLILCSCVLHSLDPFEGRDHVLLIPLSLSPSRVPGLLWVPNKCLLSKWMSDILPENAMLYHTFIFLYLLFIQFRLFFPFSRNAFSKYGEPTSHNVEAAKGVCV